MRFACAGWRAPFTEGVSPFHRAPTLASPFLNEALTGPAASPPLSRTFSSFSSAQVIEHFSLLKGSSTGYWQVKMRERQESCFNRFCMFSSRAAAGSPPPTTDGTCRFPAFISQNDAKALVGDIQALRPTILAGVPRIFDRIYAGVMAKASPTGPSALRPFAPLLPPSPLRSPTPLSLGQCTWL